MTIEFWYFMKDSVSTAFQVLAGLTPYKIRKLPTIDKIELQYNGMYSYCPSNLDSKQVLMAPFCLHNQ